MNSVSSEFDNKDIDLNKSVIRTEFYQDNSPPEEPVSKGFQQAIQFKNILFTMKDDLSVLNSLLNRKRRKYFSLVKQQSESKDKINVFYNDYNNFLIKFFHFNSDNYDSSNNGEKEFSFGLNEDLGLNENFNEANNNYFYQKNSSNKSLVEKKIFDFKIIGIVNKIFKFIL